MASTGHHGGDHNPDQEKLDEASEFLDSWWNDRDTSTESSQGSEEDPSGAEPQNTETEDSQTPSDSQPGQSSPQ